jgi:hypothetical protein
VARVKISGPEPSPTSGFTSAISRFDVKVIAVGKNGGPHTLVAN